jgi:subtilisin-like proprotein convertase family protein
VEDFLEADNSMNDRQKMTFTNMMNRLISILLNRATFWILVLGSGGGGAFGATPETYTFDVVDSAASDIGEAGYVDSRVLSGSQIIEIESIKVTLNLSAELAGDVYAYLVHDTGRVVLLNRVGRKVASPLGYLDRGGFQVVFEEGAAQGDIHVYQDVTGELDETPVTGGWLPDGRDVDPLVVFDTDARTATLNSFVGLDANGTWDLFVADVLEGDVTGLTSWSLDITGSSAEDKAPQVVARHLFYNNSAFDQDSAAINVLDDAGIATDKGALLDGQQASLTHVSSYYSGINGVMIDTSNVPLTVATEDFAFKVGNSDDPSTWSAGPTPVQIGFRAGGGTSGSDRITLVWTDNNRDGVDDANEAPHGKWMQITFLANAKTGLATNDVFYFGNAIGETGNDANSARVTSADILLVRNNPKSFLSPASVTDAYDINRDTKVNAADVLLVRNHVTSFLNELKLIDLTGGIAASPRFNARVRVARLGAEEPIQEQDGGGAESGEMGVSVGKTTLDYGRSGPLNLSFRGIAGGSYSVFYKDSLSAIEWEMLDASVLEVSPGWFVVSDPVKTSSRFYQFKQNGSEYDQ